MLGDRIEQLRVNSNLKPEQLAKRLGKSVQTINNWEKGSLNPSLDMLLELCNIFSVTPNYLLGFDNHNLIDVTGLAAYEVGHISLLIYDLKNKEQ